MVHGRLQQRNWERDGQNRSSIEIQVDEIGPSLRYAQAQVTRIPRSGGGFNQGGQSGYGQVSPAGSFNQGGSFNQDMNQNLGTGSMDMAQPEAAGLITRGLPLLPMITATIKRHRFKYFRIRPTK